MSSTARDRVLSRLREAVQHGDFNVPETSAMPVMQWNQEEKIDRLQTLMTNMHTEVHRTSRVDWLNTVKEIIRQRKLQNLFYGLDTELSGVLESAWESDLPTLVPYQQDIEAFKEKLFDADAGITLTRGAIAETGAIVLWPSAQEPRLLSLVPAVHIAVLEADKIYSSLGEMMAAERWQDSMPTNALLISGPSKTADIELTLTFGVHGPKALIVLILEN